jgi:hypothetical protein
MVKGFAHSLLGVLGHVRLFFMHDVNIACATAVTVQVMGAGIH